MGKKSGRRTRRKKKKSRVPKFGSALFPLQPAVCTKHRFVTYVSLDPTTTPVANYYRCNGMYDPDLTGGGHQPMYYDEMYALYAHHTVIGSKITVTAQGGITSLGSLPIMFIARDVDTTVPTDLGDIVEQTNSKVKWRQMKVDGTMTKVTNTWSIYKDCSVKDPMDARNDWGAVGNTNPLKQYFFHVGYGALDASDVSGIKIIVQIDYTCIWTDPVDTGGS